VPLVVAGVVVLHVAVLVRLSPAGVRPDILLLLAITAGLTGGRERGAGVGFAAGLLGDLFVGTPLGLSALTLTLVGFGVGVMSSTILRATWWIGPATAFVASAGAVVLYGVTGAVVGRAAFLSPELAVIALVVASVNALLAVPMVRATTWAFAGGRPERAYA
jgi:rod shape-determining protein MreD